MVFSAECHRPALSGDSGKQGHPPIGLERILRMYIVQQCFGFSDEGTEDAVYNNQAIRRFVGIDLSREATADATTLLKFRHLLEAHHLTQSIVAAINAHLAERGLFLREGTIVDATLVGCAFFDQEQGSGARYRNAPNQERKAVALRYEGAHRSQCAIRACSHPNRNSRKCSRCYSGTGLLHGDETDVFSDEGYQSVEKREENLELLVAWHIAMRPSKRKALPKTTAGELLEKLEHVKASIRAKVEHPFQ